MEIIAVNGSGRRDGNCGAIALSLFSFLQDLGLEGNYRVLELADLCVQPCHGCNYQCFHSSCPLKDDAEELIAAMYRADLVFLLAPTYGGLPPASLVALMERRQAYMDGLELAKQFVVGIVLANAVGSETGEFTPEIVESWVSHWGAVKTAFLRIQPRDYQESSLQVGLADNELVKRQLLKLAKEIVNYYVSSGRTPGE